MRTQTAAAAHPNLVAFRLFLALGVTVPMAAQTPAINDAFARMDKTSVQFKAVVANMKRDIHTAVINEDAIDMGTIKIKREKSRDTRMLIELTSPTSRRYRLMAPR